MFTLLAIHIACTHVADPDFAARPHSLPRSPGDLSMSDPIALYDQADKLKDEGKIEESAAKLKEALAADPSYAPAHSALAVVLQKVGKHEETIEHARRACELEPNDPFSFTALSVTYQRAFAGTNNQQYIRMAEDAMEQSRMLQGRH